jgi:hypothetical protein
VYSSAGSVPPPSHLTSCTPTKSNLYLASSLETVYREPTLYKLLTFQVPNLISVFHSLARLSKESVQVRGSLGVFATIFFLRWMVFNPTPIPKLEDHLLFSVRDCLFDISAANLHSWRSFLHPQPEDAPCYGDRDPPNMDSLLHNIYKFSSYLSGSTIKLRSVARNSDH